MYALIDCNNFYVSCERIFNPTLSNQAVVVLSNNDGCVISRSEEAKQLGIPMGAPFFQYKSLFQKNNVKIFSSNYALYADISERVMNILNKYTPDIEVYSIDESFLKFNGYDDFFNIEKIAHQIKQEILKGVGVPTCVGLAPTKALAKIANRIAKKFPKQLNGIYSIDSEEKRIKALKWIAIEDVWGIGRRLAARLRFLNINNAYDFTQLSDQYIRKEFSVVELRLKKELLGESVLKLEDIKNKKNIATTRSFEHDENDFEFVKERVVTFASSCAEKLRKQNSNANLISVFIQTNPQKETLQYRRNVVLKLPFASNSSITLAKYAIKGLEQIYKEGFAYKRAGVIVSGITDANQKQLNLFSDEDSRHQELMKTIDGLNRKIGETKIKLGSQDLERTWKMRQEHLSKNYTTNINQLIEIDLNLA
ncbi:Y-family DNA polymerase [Faecalibacter macacae]|uniref:Y-family DNA polymerase n=1 Tax=Faecalibacter macacae TaxID=1859289 RepID=A0A3L9MC14_9FLAO|nr:Y-family DNA polymerase [Faecalibacter macacae]RLZ08069.1 Y-family DNA polymerase [Faecalibacter macacae]